MLTQKNGHATKVKKTMQASRPPLHNFAMLHKTQMKLAVPTLAGRVSRCKGSYGICMLLRPPSVVRLASSHNGCNTASWYELSTKFEWQSEAAAKIAGKASQTAENLAAASIVVCSNHSHPDSACSPLRQTVSLSTEAQHRT